jgi:hypothetical protein
MSPADLAAMSDDALVEEFIRLGQSMPSVLAAESGAAQTPKRAALVADVAAVGAELRARKPLEKLRSLCDDENPAVRMFAGLQFFLVDAEWALAAISSVRANMRTRDLVALCARAKRSPPKRPTLEEMSVTQLAARFEDAGIRCYATHFMNNGQEAWDTETSNRIMTEQGDTAEELTSRDSLDALLPLLDHANICVRNSAAACCLPIAPERAVRVLEAIKEGEDSIERGNAASTLDRWRKKNAPPPTAAGTTPT